MDAWRKVLSTYGFVLPFQRFRYSFAKCGYHAHHEYFERFLRALSISIQEHVNDLPEYWRFLINAPFQVLPRNPRGLSFISEAFPIIILFILLNS